LCDLYGVSDQIERATLLGLARRASSPEWWHPYRDLIPPWFTRYLSLEQAASVIRGYAAQVIPGLLQTPGYARAVITVGHGGIMRNGGAAGEQAERQVELRMRRQDVLRRPQPVHVWMVLDEAALRRPIGGRAVMRVQLRHLISVCDLAHVTIGVLPFRLGGHPASGGPVTVLRLPDQQLPDVVYLEQLASGLYFDEPGEGTFYRHVMNRLVLLAESAGPAQAVLAQILRET
jgi:hypothetical protein